MAGDQVGQIGPELLTIKETAKILRVDPVTVRRWAKEKKVMTYRLSTAGKYCQIYCKRAEIMSLLVPVAY